MKATRSTSIKRAFVLHLEQLRRIVGVIQAVGDVKFKVTCAGGLSLEPSTIEEMLSIPNVGDYRIESLEIASWKEPTVRVAFTGRESGVPITLYLSGDDKQVLQISDALNREVLLVSRGRWPELFEILIGNKLFIAMLSGEACALALLFAFRPKSLNSFWTYLAGLIPLWLSFSALLVATLWLWFERIYPKGIFLIGAGVPEYESMKFRRQQLSVWTLIAGLIAAGAFAIIGHWFRF